MIEILILLVLTQRIGKIVEAKGYKSGKYKWLTVGLWFGGELTGLFLGAILPSNGWSPYVFGLIGAAAGAWLAYSVAKNLSPVEAGALPLGSQAAESQQTQTSPTVLAPGDDAPSHEAPTTLMIEDLVRKLRQSPPLQPLCHVILFGDRPLTAKLQGECILCFTNQSRSEEFMVKYQGIYYCTRPLSALAVGQTPELWSMLNGKADDSDYEPPYGLIINFSYSGQPFGQYSVADLQRIGVDGLTKGFAMLPR